MAEPQTAPAEVATPAAAKGSPASIIEILESAAAEIPDLVPAKGAQAAPIPKPAPAGFVDPLDDAAFDETKLATPEGIKAARAVLQEQLKEAKKIRAAAHNARAEAERRVSKIAERGKQLEADKALTSTERAAAARDIADLQSGDPDKFIAAVGRLANAKDAHEFWTRTAISLAKGKPVEQAQDSVSAELKREIEALKSERQAEREQAVAQAESNQIMQLRIAQVQEARTFTDLEHVANLSQEQPALIDARLVAIKQDHFNRTGTPLDTRSACGILEAEIHSHLELLQRAGNRNAALNGEKGAAAPVAGQVRPPERAIANPEPAPTPNAHRSTAAIPAALSAEPASTKRPRTKAEKDAAIAAGLQDLGIFENFGMR